MKNLKISGILYFLAGGIAIMGIITAEAVYPISYATFHAEMNNPANSGLPIAVIYNPASSIFNLTMFLAGILSLAASVFQHFHFTRMFFTIPIVLFSFGLCGIGIFTGLMNPFYNIVTFMAFLAGGIAAVCASKIISSPFKYFSLAFGLIGILSWFTLVLAPKLVFPHMVLGGNSRWIIYPIMIWLTGLGGYFMSGNNQKI